MIEKRITPDTVAPPIRRRLQRLRSDQGLRLLQRAKAHLWTDWLNKGTDHASAIEFLSDFIIYYGKVEGLAPQSY